MSIFTQVCDAVKQEDFSVAHIRNQGSYATKGHDWISFTDTVDIRERASWIENMDLGGAVLFVLQFDDYNNLCQCEKYPLLKTINRAFGSIGPDPNRLNCSLFDPQAKMKPQEQNSSMKSR